MGNVLATHWPIRKSSLKPWKTFYSFRPSFHLSLPISWHTHCQTNYILKFKRPGTIDLVYKVWCRPWGGGGGGDGQAWDWLTVIHTQQVVQYRNNPKGWLLSWINSEPRRNCKVLNLKDLGILRKGVLWAVPFKISGNYFRNVLEVANETINKTHQLNFEWQD